MSTSRKHVKARSLPLIKPQVDGLGEPTIMNRTLAAKHGSRYVHLAVVAIDIDRVYRHLDDDAFKSEITLTKRYLTDHFDPAQDADCALLEDTCLDIMEGYDETDLLGAQIPFAVHELVTEKIWPDAWPVLFSAWKVPRKSKNAPELPLARIAESYLSFTLEPPIANPTRQFLLTLTKS